MRIQTRIATALALVGVACRPSDILSVPAPAGVVARSALQNQAGAGGSFNAAKAQLFNGLDAWSTGGLLTWTGLLTDEFSFSGYTYWGSDANVDARQTVAGGGYSEVGDTPWENILEARSSLLSSIPGLVQYEPASARSSIGEAYALAGYAELIVAESYCAGTPLSEVRAGGIIQYGTPLTTDSLLGTAVAHFDSAAAATNGSAVVTSLAAVGLGRALLDLGQFQAAAAAVSVAPTGFVYNVELPTTPPALSGTFDQPNPYAGGIALPFFRIFNVADGKGENGLQFISARDPRLQIDSSLKTSDGVFGGVTPGTWYLPIKFEKNPSYVPLATGLEARLIEAEAALQSGLQGAWEADLDALRADSADTQIGGLPALGADSSSAASPAMQVDVMFREREFWLFGTGTRVGDLRRLVRQYGRDQSTVFPVGPYPNGRNAYLPSPLPSYGTDVSFTLPTPAGGLAQVNPNYKGCIASTKAA